MSKKNYKKSRKYKKMRRRKIIFGIEITVLLILSGILFVYAWINRSMDKMNQDTLDPDATLAGLIKSAEDDAFQCMVKVGILIDDHGGVAAQFQHQFFLAGPGF